VKRINWCQILGRQCLNLQYSWNLFPRANDDSRIDDFVVLSGKINIGGNVHIAVHSSLTVSARIISIKDFAGISFGFHIFATSKDYTLLALTNPTVPDKFRINVEGVNAHTDCHVVIGAGSLVFPGAVIATGCSIGANSTVTRSTK
jgi:acetyltransferase-like isoleucine patch superfamily enzyme